MTVEAAHGGVVTAPVVSLAAARAKRAGSAAGSAPAGSGMMAGRVRDGRIEMRFDGPVESFTLTSAQARFWADALLTLADVVDGNAGDGEDQC